MNLIERHTNMLEANVSPCALLMATNYTFEVDREIVGWLGAVRERVEERERDAVKQQKAAEREVARKLARCTREAPLVDILVAEQVLDGIKREGLSVVV